MKNSSARSTVDTIVISCSVRLFRALIKMSDLRCATQLRGTGEKIAKPLHSHSLFLCSSLFGNNLRADSKLRPRHGFVHSCAQLRGPLSQVLASENRQCRSHPLHHVHQAYCPSKVRVNVGGLVQAMRTIHTMYRPRFRHLSKASAAMNALY